MTASTQPAIETIREALGKPEDWIAEDSSCGDYEMAALVRKACAALSAVEADLRRKDEALLRISEWGQNCTIPEGFEAADVRDAVAMIARSGLAPVSPSEPVPQQAEDVPS